MQNKGFTLIEIAIVTMIVGILSIPLFHMYNEYIIKQQYEVTRENIDTIQSLISSFVIVNKRYPCPADASKDPTDPEYGIEQCKYAGNIGKTPPAPTNTLAIGGCLPNNSFCRVTSTRTIAPSVTPEAVLVGAVPVATLILENRNGGIKFSESFNRGLDGWGNQLTYAVTDNMTDRLTYNMQRGAINIITEFNLDIGGRPLTDPTYFHYIVVSHGKDGVGAFSRNGQRISLCTSGIYGDPDGPTPDGSHPPGTVAMKDVLNCDLNATFLSSISHETPTSDPTHYDDIISPGVSATSALWEYVRDAGVKTNHIRNLNQGKVGISISPVATLDVGPSTASADGKGDIRAETQIRSPKFCTKNDTACFTTAGLVTANSPPPVANEGTLPDGTPKALGVRCANGRAMIGISRGDEVCGNVMFPPAGTWTPQTCGGGTPYLKGLTSDGKIECTN